MLIWMWASALTGSEPLVLDKSDPRVDPSSRSSLVVDAAEDGVGDAPRGVIDAAGVSCWKLYSTVSPTIVHAAGVL